LGSGVPLNHSEEVMWFHKAAEQGHAEAQYNLGVNYGKGQGVPQDYSEAVKWLRMAAEQGDPDAQSGVLKILCQSFNLYKRGLHNDKEVRF
jgi:TPR repeat protein